MTRIQRLLDFLGLWRFRFYRRWVGGRWAERYVEATPHSTELAYWRWVLDPRATLDAATHAIEQWGTKLLPEAKGRYRE